MARRDDICEHLNPIMFTYYRQKRYKTRAAFAKRMGVTSAAVDAWENGVRKPTWANVIKAAEILNTSPRMLIKRSKRHIIDDFHFHLLEFLKSPPEVKKVTKVEVITEEGKESYTKTEGKLKLTAREAIDLADKLGHFPKLTVSETDVPDTPEAVQGKPDGNPLWHWVQDWNYDAESVIRIPLKEYILPKSPNLRRLMSCILNCRESELLISGKRDCGKTYQIWHCLLTLHELIPNCQTLIARLEATTLGLLLTQLDTKILKYGLEDERNPFVFKSGSKSDPRRHILFDNGSKMAFVGLDSGEKVLGGEHDIFWFNECHRQLPNHSTEDDWTKVLGGMVDGRAGNWGEGRYLAIGDCNPSHKRHWAYLRAEEQGKMTHYRIKHQDHPLYYDWSPSANDWTEKGITARADLERQHTKGTYEYMRMVEGEWCNAEGAVYPMFSMENHVHPMQRQDFTAEGKYGVPKWRMSVDFGSGSINALGLIAYTPHDNTHRVFKEIYKSDIQVSELVKLADKMLSDYQIDKSDIETCYVDHQTDCWKQMRDAGYPTQLADKDVIAGVETCKRVIGDGRWIVNADSLYEPDMSLAIRCYVHEVMAYAYKDDSKKNGSLEDDKPVKKDDHSMDWKRYYLHGEEGGLIELPFSIGEVIKTNKRPPALV